MPLGDAKLSKVNITFLTHDDNKDPDTRLFVLVQNRISIFLSETLAGDETTDISNGEQFGDKPPSIKPFSLKLASTEIKLSDLNVPTTSITIAPNGHDRWIFDYSVELVFTTDSGATKTFTSSENGIILDQDNRQHVGVFGT